MGHAYLHSPIGWLKLTASEKELVEIEFLKNKPRKFPDKVSPLLKKSMLQLDEYFTGKRKKFELPVATQGSDFQREVMRLVAKVPFGKVATYGDIARRLGDPNSVRAIGGANGRNKLPIVIPCHRVVGKSGKLIGYSGGIDKKKWLLEHEGSLRQVEMF